MDKYVIPHIALVWFLLHFYSFSSEIHSNLDFLIEDLYSGVKGDMVYILG